jgi:hypothetical protein
MRRGSRQVRGLIGCVALLSIVLTAHMDDAAASGNPRFEAPTLAGLGYTATLAQTSTLSTTGRRRLADFAWLGGRYTVATGETVTVYISATYGASDEQAREWANWFASLPHGAELGLVTAYLAPLGEVESICGSTDVLGCYGDQRLVSLGDSSSGMPPASIAAHEYGHHVANNRSNAPWTAIDWGTKRWATSMHICARVAASTAFPGDEGFNYALNPGEGFAESYRVLVEMNGTGEGYDWPIVDASFRPDAEALAAVREDVLHPWAGPTTTTVRGTFLRRSRVWASTVPTPRDGDVRVQLTVPGGEIGDVKLVTDDGRATLATGSWDSRGGKSLAYRVCGARSLRVRLTRNGAATRFTLRITVP